MKTKEEFVAMTKRRQSSSSVREKIARVNNEKKRVREAALKAKAWDAELAARRGQGALIDTSDESFKVVDVNHERTEEAMIADPDGSKFLEALSDNDQ